MTTAIISGLDKSPAWGDEFQFPNSRTFRQYTHRIFNRYPARSISLVPRSILSGLASQKILDNRRLRVLDPFMGSGTTAVEAALQGIDAYGVELDPFARLVTEVSTRAYRDSDLCRLEEQKQKIGNISKSISTSSLLTPRLAGIERWFTAATFSELLKLKSAIYECTDGNQEDLDFFRVVFADTIRPCSKAERQSLKPYISKKYKKVEADVHTTFEKSFRSQFNALLEFSAAVEHRPSTFKWVGQNGTNFEAETQVDVAITSPPYINALDYIRCIKMESTWAGCSDDNSLRTLRKDQVGDNARRSIDIDPLIDSILEPVVDAIGKKDRIRAQVVLAYFQDISANLAATHRALRADGEYHLIVGDSVIKGIEVQTHRLIAEIAKRLRFEWVGYYRYTIKDHRTSIPRKGQGGKIHEEHVVSLRKA